MWTDSHCHLEAKDFTRDGVDERAQVIARARAAGVERMICVGSGAGFDEIANVVVFVASKEAAVTNGAAVRAEGGIVDTIA